MRHFTPEEANAELEHVRPLVEQLVATRQRARRRARAPGGARAEDPRQRRRHPACRARPGDRGGRRRRAAPRAARRRDHGPRRPGEGPRQRPDRLPGAATTARRCCSAGSSARTRSPGGTASTTALPDAGRCRSTRGSTQCAANRAAMPFWQRIVIAAVVLPRRHARGAPGRLVALAEAGRRRRSRRATASCGARSPRSSSPSGCSPPYS